MDGLKVDFDFKDLVCVLIVEGLYFDVIEIDGVLNNGVEQVCDLCDMVQYVFVQGKFKIYIIDEVYMFLMVVFNVLLKIFEELLVYVKFVFVMIDLQKVLLMIILCCQCFDLKLILVDLIVLWLKKIVDEEKIKVLFEVFVCIVCMVDGGMCDVQLIFDQMILFCGMEIFELDVLDVYGFVLFEKIVVLVVVLVIGDYLKIIEIVDVCDQVGCDLVWLLIDLQELVCWVLFDVIGKGGKIDIFGGVLMMMEQIMCLFDGFCEGEGSVKFGLLEKINFEVILFKVVDVSCVWVIDLFIKELSVLVDEVFEFVVVFEGGEKKKD